MDHIYSLNIFNNNNNKIHCFIYALKNQDSYYIKLLEYDFYKILSLLFFK